jgi:hypothetical protein
MPVFFAKADRRDRLGQPHELADRLAALQLPDRRRAGLTELPAANMPPA